MEFEKRFWEKVARGEPDECWEWQAGRTSKGYGSFYIKGKNKRAHRVAYLLANGEAPPDGLFVMHSCDNPPCVNPAHLSAGSHRQNTDDRIAKGRAVYSTVVLAPCDVASIRQRVADGEKAADVGRAFNISYQRLYKLLHGETYKDDGGPIAGAIEPRHRPASETRSPLSADDVLEIRAAHARGARSVDLAARFDVGPGCISKIVRRIRWANLGCAADGSAA
jgi:hypothetical protein